MFTAQYSGECFDCGQEVKGTQCTYSTNGVIHIRCPKPVKICEECFLQKPCACDEDRQHESFQGV